MLAAKVHDEQFGDNSWYATLAGLDVALLNKMELEFCSTMGWNFAVARGSWRDAATTILNAVPMTRSKLPSVAAVETQKECPAFIKHVILQEHSPRWEGEVPSSQATVEGLMTNFMEFFATPAVNYTECLSLATSLLADLLQWADR